jgi:phosphoribosylformylglycinamidine synthase
MCAIVEPVKINEFLAICKKWDVTVTVIGEVAEGERLNIFYHNELIVDVPPRTVAHEGPVYNRPIAKPSYIDSLKPVSGLPAIRSAEEIKNAVIKLLSTPNIADKSWVTSQYDRYVQGNTVLSQPEDGGMIRIDEETNLGVAISTDANARWSYINPYRGVQQALAESCRNIAAGGAKPLALTNCLNFGSPEDAGVMWQFKETVTGLADAALALGLPVTGGNVSFYNQTGEVAILPTPVIGVLGVIQDVTQRTDITYKQEGESIFLIGSTSEDLSGSEWAHIHGEMGSTVPELDYVAFQKNIDFLLANQDLFTSAHDVSNGGLIATIFESTRKSGIGANLDLTKVSSDLAVALFSESPDRTVVTIAPVDEAEFIARAQSASQVVTKVGVTGGSSLIINGTAIPLSEIEREYTATLPALFA